MYGVNIMVVKVTVTGADQARDAIEKALRDFMTSDFVTVGIHEDAGQHESDDITNAQLGAIHEFGADIDHPGGTSFGFASKAAEARNEVRFLKKGKGFLELGVTGPYKINIPARPWLTPGVQSGNDEYLQIITAAVEAGKPLKRALEQVGVVAASKVQVYMTQLKEPANAASTIKKKGSANPLIDSGALRQSVTYKVVSSEPTEGI